MLQDHKAWSQRAQVQAILTAAGRVNSCNSAAANSLSVVQNLIIDGSPQWQIFRQVPVDLDTLGRSSAEAPAAEQMSQTAKPASGIRISQVEPRKPRVGEQYLQSSAFLLPLWLPCPCGEQLSPTETLLSLPVLACS